MNFRVVTNFDISIDAAKTLGGWIGGGFWVEWWAKLVFILLSAIRINRRHPVGQILVSFVFGNHVFV